MDDRQRQIREGAGLVESQLNTAFIDWLRKWSTPILVVAAVLLLGYMGWQKMQEAKVAKVNRAFAELAAASQGPNPSPDSLRRVADEFDGIRAVSHMARLAAADIYLESLRRGTKVGRTPGLGVIPPEDLLSPDERDGYLRECESLYQSVLSRTQSDKAMALHALGASFGLAAVAECRGDLETARRRYDLAKGIAEAAGISVHARIAQSRIDSLATLPEPVLPQAGEVDPPAGTP